MPHNGEKIPAEIAENMTASALDVVDTDWYMDKIYHFTKIMGCSVINPYYSRYVIDLNRPENDEPLYPGADTTELCPTTQFDSQSVYLPGKAPSSDDIELRIRNYWQPYHQQLEKSLKQIKAQFGYVLLFEAHSIKSVVPRFFAGKLADFNFGNYNQKTCSNELTQLIKSWDPKEYSKVVNGRFKGGHITRYYADPENQIETLQLELSQATYMNEELLEYNENKANKVIIVIQDLFENIRKYSLLKMEHP